MKRLSNEIWQQIEQDFNQGLSKSALAKKYNVARQSIQDHFASRTNQQFGYWCFTRFGLTHCQSCRFANNKCHYPQCNKLSSNDIIKSEKWSDTEQFLMFYESNGY